MESKCKVNGKLRKGKCKVNVFCGNLVKKYECPYCDKYFRQNRVDINMLKNIAKPKKIKMQNQNFSKRIKKR